MLCEKPVSPRSTTIDICQIDQCLVPASNAVELSGIRAKYQTNVNAASTGSYYVCATFLTKREDFFTKRSKKERVVL